MSAGPEWGPLARLAGIWEGDKGEDVAYSNEKGSVGLTPYREHTELKPFGPVENGIQTLYGLDYRMAAWHRKPFHTEVGYCGTPPTAGDAAPRRPIAGGGGRRHQFLLRGNIDVSEDGGLLLRGGVAHCARQGARST